MIKPNGFIGNVCTVIPNQCFTFCIIQGKSFVYDNYFFQERVYGFHHLPHALNGGYSVHVPQNTIGSHCSLLTLFRYQRFAIK